YFGAASDTITTRVSPIVKLDPVLDKLTGDLYLRVRTNGRGRNHAFVARLEVVARAPEVDSAEDAWLRDAEALRDAALKQVIPNSAGNTAVGGDLTANTTWTADKSPYLLLGDLRVAPTATLTIEPGVTVRV